MRVLVNAVAARRGGGAHHLGPFMVDLAEVLSEASFDVFITADAPTLPSHPRIEFHIVDIPAGISPKRLWWDTVTVARRARAYDLVISPLNFGPIWCQPPHVLFQRNALYFDPLYTSTQPLSTRLRLAVFRWLAIVQSNTADRVVVPTEAMAALIRPRLRRPSKVVVAPHTIDVEACRARAALPVTARAGDWVDRHIRLLHVGTPTAHKGLDTMAETFVRVHDELPHSDIGLAVTCDADDPADAVVQFREIIESAGLADQITWLGRVDHDEVFALYRCADVALLPSWVESFGYPVLEALSVGCPVVASDLPAIREVAMGRVGLHRVGDARGAAALVRAAVLDEGCAEPGADESQLGMEQPDSQARTVAELARVLTGAQREPQDRDGALSVGGGR